MTATLTRPRRVVDGLVGSEAPRVWTPPLRELTPETSLGFALIEFADEVLAIPLLPWQRWLAIHGLELLPDGRFRFSRVVVMVARQNGKSTFSQVLALFYLFVLRVAQVMGAAQDVSSAKDIWSGVCQIVEDLYELRRERQGRERTTNGQIELKLKAGRRYIVKPSTPGGARGQSNDLVMLDELREQSDWGGWEAAEATTAARSKSQVWAFSNAGDVKSVVLQQLRLEAHAALGDPDGVCAAAHYDGDPAGERHGWFEWSAPRGLPLLDGPSLAQANPALGHGFVTLDSIAAKAGGREWGFRTEYRCEWPVGSLDEPFPPGSWDAGKIEAAEDDDEILGEPVACVEVSFDRSRAAIVYAGYRPDGRPQAELVAYVPGAEAAAEWLSAAERTVRPAYVMLRPNSPAAPIKADLQAAGLDVRDWKGSDVAGGCALTYDLVRGREDIPGAMGGLRHCADPDLDRAARAARTRQSGDVWTWDLSRSPVDASPLYALSGALWGLLHEEVAEPVAPSFLATGRLVVI